MLVLSKFLKSKQVVYETNVVMQILVAALPVNDILTNMICCLMRGVDG